MDTLIIQTQAETQSAFLALVKNSFCIVAKKKKNPLFPELFQNNYGSASLLTHCSKTNAILYPAVINKKSHSRLNNICKIKGTVKMNRKTSKTTLNISTMFWSIPFEEITTLQKTAISTT